MGHRNKTGFTWDLSRMNMESKASGATEVALEPAMDLFTEGALEGALEEALEGGLELREESAAPVSP